MVLSIIIMRYSLRNAAQLKLLNTVISREYIKKRGNDNFHLTDEYKITLLSARRVLGAHCAE